MKLYKVLDKDMKSPYKAFPFELGKKYVCDDFDDDKTEDCSRGFYATEFDGLPYAYRINRRVFECEVGGKSVEVDCFKRRYETQELIREIKKDELIETAKIWDEKLGYKISGVIDPVNPLILGRTSANDSDMNKLKECASVWDSVGASVRASVGAPVWDSVGASVWGSVGAPVWDSVGASVWASVSASVWDSVGTSVWDSVGTSVWAYIGSLFPGINKWSYIEHKSGEYPFQPAVDLWESGLVPSYNGNIWRLHGEGGQIVYEEK